jgi:purine-nucleoside phosphorylase
MLTDAVGMAYREVPGWPESRVIGHQGMLVVGEVAGQRLAVLAGRVHGYEGHPWSAVVYGVRVMAKLGVRTLILTNAAGAINLDISAGSVMIIDDHINLMGGNPLVGLTDERFGERFPDMSEVYSVRLRNIADEVSAEQGLPIAHGVYAGLLGPSYETPAEIRYLRAIGADAVGMSTVPEAIAARHMGVEVLGLSCITNMAAGVWQQPLVHGEVLKTVERVRGTVTSLLEGLVERI